MDGFLGKMDSQLSWGHTIPALLILKMLSDQLYSIRSLCLRFLLSQRETPPILTTLSLCSVQSWRPSWDRLPLDGRQLPRSLPNSESTVLSGGAPTPRLNSTSVFWGQVIAFSLWNKMKCPLLSGSRFHLMWHGAVWWSVAFYTSLGRILTPRNGGKSCSPSSCIPFSGRS